MRAGISITVSPSDHRRLEALVRDRNTSQKHVWRAEIVLLSTDGIGTNEIMRRTGKSKTCVWRWQERFAEVSFNGLLRDKTRPSRVKPLGDEVSERVVALTLTDPPGEATHWTGAMLAGAVGISVSSVQRIWRVHGLRRTGFVSSSFPTIRNSSTNSARSPGSMSIHPLMPSCSASALDRTQPGLPLKKGRAGTMTHDYKRHGTTTLFAALNVPRRQSHRPQYAAPAPSGVHPFPQCHRGGSPGRQDRASRSSARSPTSKLPSTASSTSTTNNQDPSHGPPTQTKSSPPSIL